MRWETTLEIVFCSLGLGIIILYHTIMFLICYRVPKALEVERDADLLLHWMTLMAEHTIVGETLRVFMLGTTFLAYATVGFLMWICSTLLSSDHIEIPIVDFTHSVQSQTIIKAKLLLITFCLFASFYFYLQTMVHCVDLGFYINICRHTTDYTRHDATQKMRRMTYSLWLGMRGWYVAAVGFCYLLGPSWFLAVCILSVLVCVATDANDIRTPRPLRTARMEGSMLW